MLKQLAPLFLACCTLAHSQITLQFSTVGAALTNLSNSDGLTGINGLTWGILVDSENNGFGQLRADLSAPYQLTDGAELSPGDYFFAAGTTVTFPLGGEAGPGSATTTSSLDVYSIAEIEVGDSFALIWFDTGISPGATLTPGSHYGLITDPSFTLPADGTSNTPFSSIFAGPDPIRPTDLKVGIIFPPLDPVIVSDHFGVEFEIEIATASSVTFDLESSTSGLPTDWAAQSVTPTILSDDGTRRELRLLLPVTVIAEPNLLVRLIGTP